ncbi:F-box/FBD/LRR-repeat protein At3g52680-like [Argentina anserina]|uniref:F-box/FBD/LRR-repeat protein At3g52680-like n=1 Tax=Argentina anserina TaxID=57926 RepID=UPI0021764B8A|nr:F-box/FBD/LRR-repeat protein At3g52680-like [Potentilla anserina]
MVECERETEEENRVVQGGDDDLMHTILGSSLTVCLEDDDHDGDDDEFVRQSFSFHVNAPNLEKLVLKSVTLGIYNLENVKSLVSASITFDDMSATDFPTLSTRASSLLAGISGVNYLSFSTLSFEVEKVSNLPEAFINLKKIGPALHECNYWELLADKTECDDEHSELEWNTPEVVPVCLSSQLKTITIKGFKGQRVEMGVAKYLLNNGHVLNKLTLHTGFLYTEAEEMYKEFLMFRRAMSCQVKFINM